MVSGRMESRLVSLVISEPQLFVYYLAIFSSQLFCSNTQSARWVYSRHVQQTGCLDLHGRAFVGRPDDSPVFRARLFTLAIMQFQFGQRSGNSITFLFSLLQCHTMDFQIPL